MSKSDIDISIIIPVYNVEKYVERCLNSVINQTIKNIEIIIVNDGTKDASYGICKEIAQKDSRIRLFSKENEGLGLTRNYGIAKARGKYIAFLDSDDYVENDFYKKLFENIEDNKTDAVFGNIRLHTSDGKIVEKDKIVFKENIVNSKKFLYNLLHVEDKDDYGKCYMGMCVTRSLYRKDIIDNNKISFESERIFISEDILFNLDYCMKCNRMSFVDDAYYYYCYNGKSLTKSYKGDRFEKDIELYKEIISRLKEYGEYNEEIKCGVDSFFMEYVRGVIKQEIFNSKKCRSEIFDSIRKIIEDKYVSDAIRNCKNDNIKKNTINFFIRKKFVLPIYYIYKLIYIL